MNANMTTKVMKIQAREALRGLAEDYESKILSTIEECVNEVASDICYANDYTFRYVIDERTGYLRLYDGEQDEETDIVYEIKDEDECNSLMYSIIADTYNI